MDTSRVSLRGHAAEQRDERAALHVDFALPLIASPASACHPASLIFIRATSIILPPATMRSACADASPTRTSSTSSSAVNPFANSAVEESNHRHRRLLHARRKRPRCRAAEQRDERAPLHSITSSAVASSDGGTVSPSVLAVWRLMTNSNFTVCWTGKAAGFSPLRIRAV
jgi:hypothetical protein